MVGIRSRGVWRLIGSEFSIYAQGELEDAVGGGVRYKHVLAARIKLDAVGRSRSRLLRNELAGALSVVDLVDGDISIPLVGSQ